MEIVNVLGMHARPAARFVRVASCYHSDVVVSKSGKDSDGRSILGILFLAARVGSRIVISVNGEDEVDALEALVKLVNDGFEDDGV